jgi:hypothetical protein
VNPAPVRIRRPLLGSPSRGTTPRPPEGNLFPGRTPRSLRRRPPHPPRWRQRKDPGRSQRKPGSRIVPGGSQGPADPNLSRTAPVEPGLPGSTAASPGPVPTTVDKNGGDPHTEESSRDQDDPRWAPAPAGSFDAPDRAVGASDRWREAKLAAERERIARAAAAQPEERSPLERARRRLERLVGGGQDHSDDDISPADREEAERARRARLGFEEDDPRFR